MAWHNGQWCGPVPEVADLFDDDKPECESCESSGVDLMVYRLDSGSSKFKYAQKEQLIPYKALCEICAGTMLGVYSEWPEQHTSDSLEIMKMVAFVGNMLKKEIRQQGSQ